MEKKDRGKRGVKRKVRKRKKKKMEGEKSRRKLV